MFGQIPDFSNGFEFLRKLWATGSGMPGGLMPGLSAMTPPMDLDEVDKRIHDLKAVESWLQLNTNLLRTTIQGLEVQRATLVALPTTTDPLQALLNRTWTPTLSVTGAEGFPSLENAGNVLRPFTAFKLSLRLPPLVPGHEAAVALKALLEDKIGRAHV